MNTTQATSETFESVTDLAHRALTAAADANRDMHPSPSMLRLHAETCDRLSAEFAAMAARTGLRSFADRAASLERTAAQLRRAAR